MKKKLLLMSIKIKFIEIEPEICHFHNILPKFFIKWKTQFLELLIYLSQWQCRLFLNCVQHVAQFVLPIVWIHIYINLWENRTQLFLLFNFEIVKIYYFIVEKYLTFTSEQPTRVCWYKCFDRLMLTIFFFFKASMSLKRSLPFAQYFCV